jgi:hypothetical protein
MSRILWRTSVLLALLMVPAPARAVARFGEMGGHLSIGYAKLFTADPAGSSISPGGSISMGAGLDYPLARRLRVGLDLGYDLFGSITIQSGSNSAGVDYSAFEMAVLAHWLPERGLVRRVSLGPALVNAHGDLAVTDGGTSFSPWAVHGTAAALAARVTLMPAKPAPVKLGLELGIRRIFLTPSDWTLLNARVTVHY